MVVLSDTILYGDVCVDATVSPLPLFCSLCLYLFLSFFLPSSMPLSTALSFPPFAMHATHCTTPSLFPFLFPFLSNTIAEHTNHLFQYVHLSVRPGQFYNKIKSQQKTHQIHQNSISQIRPKFDRLSSFFFISALKFKLPFDHN
jgi:hypothetical protein